MPPSSGAASAGSAAASSAADASSFVGFMGDTSRKGTARPGRGILSAGAERGDELPLTQATREPARDGPRRGQTPRPDRRERADAVQARRDERLLGVGEV